jgi:hypothetical protein
MHRTVRFMSFSRELQFGHRLQLSVPYESCMRACLWPSDGLRVMRTIHFARILMLRVYTDSLGERVSGVFLVS